MTIDVALKGADVTERHVRGRVAVVIDVLRATTMIASLLHAGAKEVWPVKEIDDARRLASRLDGALLAGERGGLPPEGFDFGNSPREIDPAKVAGAPVVITTTNGTAAIERAARADALVTAAFVNASAVVELLRQNEVEKLLIICAGTQGEFSLDDALCAGLLVARLEQEAAGVDLSDSALGVRLLYESRREDLRGCLMACRHGRKLQGLGMGADIESALQVDRLDIVPVRTKKENGLKENGFALVAALPGARLTVA